MSVDGGEDEEANASEMSDYFEGEVFSAEFYDLVQDWKQCGTASKMFDILKFNRLSGREQVAFYTEAEG
jgi:hypothetical protein